MLVTKILNNRYTPAKRWSTRRNASSFLQLKLKIRNILNLLSGNDIINMLKSVLNREELYEISKIFVDSLKRIAENVNSKIKFKQKHKFIRPLRLAGLKKKKFKI